MLLSPVRGPDNTEPVQRNQMIIYSARLSIHDKKKSLVEVQHMKIKSHALSYRHAVM